MDPKSCDGNSKDPWVTGGILWKGMQYPDWCKLIAHCSALIPHWHYRFQHYSKHLPPAAEKGPLHLQNLLFLLSSVLTNFWREGANDFWGGIAAFLVILVVFLRVVADNVSILDILAWHWMCRTCQQLLLLSLQPSRWNRSGIVLKSSRVDCS